MPQPILLFIITSVPPQEWQTSIKTKEKEVDQYKKQLINKGVLEKPGNIETTATPSVPQQASSGAPSSSSSAIAVPAELPNKFTKDNLQAYLPKTLGVYCFADLKAPRLVAGWHWHESTSSFFVFLTGRLMACVVNVGFRFQGIVSSQVTHISADELMDMSRCSLPQQYLFFVHSVSGCRICATPVVFF